MDKLELGLPGRTSHVLVPCSSAAAPVVRKLLARDLSAWAVDHAVADGLLLAALEAVGNAVANGVRDGESRMLIISWSLKSGTFRFTVADRAAKRAAAPARVPSAAHPAAYPAHPVSTGIVGPPTMPVPMPAVPVCERRAAAMRAHPSAGAARGRGVMDAIMDRVQINAGQLGTHILLEKSL